MSNVQVDRESFQRDAASKMDTVDKAQRWAEEMTKALPKLGFAERMRRGLHDYLKAAKNLHDADPDPALSWEERRKDWIRNYLRPLPPAVGRYIMDKENLRDRNSNEGQT